jgi:hypothetical protein
VAFFYRLQGGTVRARRVWAGVAAAGVLAGLGVVGASPASAAPSAGCGLLNGANGSGVGQVVWTQGTFNAGERLTVAWSGLSDPAAVIELYVPGNVLVDVNSGAGSVTYVFAADTSADGNSSLSGTATGTWLITCGTPPGTAPSIPDWHQAYARDKDATCLDGWSPSWHSWAEPVTGGWVCHRSIPSLG